MMTTMVHAKLRQEDGVGDIDGGDYDDDDDDYSGGDDDDDDVAATYSASKAFKIAARMSVLPPPVAHLMIPRCSRNAVFTAST